MYCGYGSCCLRLRTYCFIRVFSTVFNHRSSASNVPCVHQTIALSVDPKMLFSQCDKFTPYHCPQSPIIDVLHHIHYAGTIPFYTTLTHKSSISNVVRLQHTSLHRLDSQMVYTLHVMLVICHLSPHQAQQMLCTIIPYA